MEKAKYSIDSDGTFLSRKGTGDFPVTQYDCRNASNCVATFRLKMGEKVGEFRQVFAYSTFDEKYRKMIEDGEALCELGVFCSRNREIRRVTSRAPVMQVGEERYSFNNCRG